MNKKQLPGNTIWQIIMLALCVYVLTALFIDTVFTLPPATSELLNLIDNAVCVIFLGDFLYSLYTAKRKLHYLKWGWIDLISSIPSIQILRWGRFARIIRIFRLLRGVKSTKVIIHYIYSNRAKGILASVALISFFLMVFSSIAVLNCETAPDSNIRTAGDALWWSLVTITTVGYGDYYPTTTLGRIIAAILMITGVGMFGTFTAYVATFFIQPEEQEERKREKDILNELKDIKQRLTQIEKKQG